MNETIPRSWTAIVDSNSESMSHDNPENHWWIHQHMETLAEELWIHELHKDDKNE